MFRLHEPFVWLMPQLQEVRLRCFDSQRTSGHTILVKGLLGELFKQLVERLLSCKVPRASCYRPLSGDPPGFTSIQYGSCGMWARSCYLSANKNGSGRRRLHPKVFLSPQF